MATNIPMDTLKPEPQADEVQLNIDGSPHQPRYRKNNVSRASSYELGASASTLGSRPRHSYHGEDEATLNKQLLNQLPSRQLARQVKHVLISDEGKAKRRRPGYTTLRFAGANVAAEMAEHLMSVSPDLVDRADEETAEEIRDQYPGTTLATRIEIKQNIDKEKQKKKQKKVGAYKAMKYSMSVSWLRTKRRIAEVAYSLELWKSHFKVIEGHFGTGVTSYFLFIKWLFLMNIPVFLLIFAFVVVPQLLYRYVEPGEGYPDVNFQGQDLLTGSGWLEDTELYYGSYTNNTVSLDDNKTEYSMQYAYLLTLFAYLAVVLVVTMKSLSQSYRRNYIETSEEFDFYYVSKVFTGWDHLINNPNAAKLKHKSLFKELQEYLSGFHKEEQTKTCSQWCGLLALRVFSNLLVLGLLAGSAYLVWYISITQSLQNDLEVLGVLALPLCISAINFILPFAFSILAGFERYQHPQIELYITMLRTFALNVCTLGVLTYFWFTTVDCSQRNPGDDRWLDTELECSPCWETFMGEELYRLVVVDFIFILLITFVSEFCRRIHIHNVLEFISDPYFKLAPPRRSHLSTWLSLMSALCCKALGHPEFNIGRNTLYLIYSQMLVWLGAYYSPLLTFIHIVKLFIIFYVKRVSVTQNCVPSVKPWRGGRSHTFILGLLFAALLLAIFSFGYSIVFLTPSEECGPYKGYNATYDIIRIKLEDWSASNKTSTAFLEYIQDTITSTFFVIALFLALCVAAHISRVVARGHEEMANILKHQIRLEGEDKVFLLKLLGEAGRRKNGLGSDNDIADAIRANLANNSSRATPDTLGDDGSRNGDIHPHPGGDAGDGDQAL